jgi:FMN phosphatase YigB (HAD superfamily)
MPIPAAIRRPKNILPNSAGVSAIRSAAAEIFGDACYFSYEFLTKKPDPESYRRLVAQLGLEPAAAWFTDDKRSNVDGARIAGLHTHHFVSEAQLRQELRENQLIPS